MTTHSPLFVLGMAKEFGNDGFDVYDLPSGSRINPEEFDEFGQAFQAFKATTEFSNIVRVQVEKAQRPILFVEGATDRDYLQRAAELLERCPTLDKFEVQDAEGAGALKNIWNNPPIIRESVAKTIALLHDPECNIPNEDKGNIHRRKMPFFEGHPIAKGVENLFDRETLKKARQHNKKFIDIADAYKKTERGEGVSVPESWSIHKDEKTNLCNWLRDQGTAEDFRHFEAVFEILEETLSTAGLSLVDAPSGAIPLQEKH